MKVAQQIKLESKVEVSPEIKIGLRLTPQMRQAIDILQVPLPELKCLLDRELSENPLLEETMSEYEDGLRPDEDIDRLIEQVEDNFTDESQIYDNQAQKKKDFLENLLVRPVTLAEHLLGQLRISNLSESEQRMGEMIIGNLDDNGYLHLSLSEVAEMLEANIRVTERVLSVIQGFDPPGVCARNLEECLLIQLKAKGKEDSLASLIVKNHFFDLEMKKYEKISGSLRASIGEIKQARDEIARLEPKPGRNFDQQRAISIIPDAVLQKVDGDYRIESNTEELLHIRINPFYRKLLKESNTPQSTKKYLREKLSCALSLIKAVNHRQETIRKIIECIVDLQREFLDKGPLYLRPLQLKDIANMLGLHKSTVCRAAAGKYIQTPQGICELKYFFDDCIKNNELQPYSPKSVRAKIEELINEEDPVKPLSDEKLMQILRSQGIHIARRTVAKYREQLRILPSYLRRQ